MRVRWIGDARIVPGIGMPIAGQVYDLPDEMAASLVEQGKAVVAPPPVVLKPATKPARPAEDKE